VKWLSALVRHAEVEEPLALSRLCNNLGVALAESGDVDAGVEYLERSLELSDANATPFHNLARMYLTHHRIQKARILYERYGGHFPDAFTKAVGGRLRELEGDFVGAKELYRESIEVQPEEPYGYVGLSTLLCEVDDDYEQAVEVVREGLSHCPKEPVLLNNLGYAYLMLDQDREAREVLDRAKGGESSPYLSATRGLLLIKEGNIQEGTRLYNKAKLQANDVILARLIEQKKRIEIARYWFGQGKSTRALEELNSALQVEADEPIYKNQALRLIRLVRSSLSAGTA
jgi:tetratricopeptide (TPR) repeat protein